MTPQGRAATPAPSARHELAQRSFHGLIWMLGQNGAARALALVSQMVLARLLDTADFGLIGLAYSVQTMATSLVAFGVDDVILQRARTMRLWLGVGFIISLGLSVLAAALLLAASPIAAKVYEAPQIVGLLALMALSLPISALANIPSIVLRSELRFKFIAAYSTVELTAQTMFTVALAWGGFGAYSFVIPVPVLAVFKAVIYWQKVGRRLTFHTTHLRRWHMLTGKGLLSWLTRLTTTGIGQGDYALLGMFTSKAVVGQYYFAYRLASQPVTILAGNVGQVLMPALVRLRTEPLRQGAAALQAAKLLSFAIMPVAFIQAAMTAPFLTWLFGAKWAGAIPIMEVLSIGVALDAVSWITGSLLAARGEFHLAFRYVVFQLPVFFLSIGVGLFVAGGLGVAVGVAVFYAITQPIYSYLCLRRGGSRIRDVAWIYLGPTLGAALAAACGLAAASLPGIAGLPWLRLLVIGSTSSVAYLAWLALVAPEVVTQISQRLLASLKLSKTANQ